MLKKNSKLIAVVILFILLSIVACTSVYGLEHNPIDDPEYFKPNELENADSLTNIGNSIVTLINIIGVVASVVTLFLIGIKYMTGSLEEKANYKQTMIPYIIGAVLLFASSFFVNIIYNVIMDIQG